MDSIKGFLKRSGWASLAVLFVVTGLGVGVYGFWQATHQNPGSAYITCKSGSPAKQPSGKLAGKQLGGFTPIKKTNLLTCVDLKVGTGTQANFNSKITANYIGAVASTGKIFQSSLDNNGQPFSASLNGGVIAGWSDGIPGMRAGGERRLIIPAIYAYGPSPPPGSGIPANADLVFDITLLAVQ